jgi:glycerol-3-phosphate dehydrogenase
VGEDKGASAGVSDGVGAPERIQGFLNLLNINSPGLSAAPAIALDVAGKIASRLEASVNESFVPHRKAIVSFEPKTFEEKAALVAEDKNYTDLVCRCESVTLAEILSAIHRPVGATTLDGVKRRTRAMMGKCQGAYCSARIMEILAKELHESVYDITKSGGKSNILEKGL